MKKRMKDRPGLLDDAQRIADAGRKGDKLVAHITPEEAALLKARGGSGTVNPKTGLLEFYDGGESGNDATGGGNAGNMGGYDGGYGGYDGGGLAGALPGEPNIDGTPNGPVNQGAFADFSSTPGESYANALQNNYQPRGFFERAGDYVGRGFQNALYDFQQNPIANVLDLAVPGLFGLGNMASKAMTGKSVGSTLTGWARDITDYESSPDKQMAAALEGEPDPTPSEPGGNDINRASDAPLSPQQVASQTTPQQVAQDALRRAFMVNPGLLNQWTGNQFTAAGTAGKPNAYNQWQGNQLYRPPVFPGLVG